MNGAQRGMVSSLLGAAFWLSVTVCGLSFVPVVDWDGMVTTEAERGGAEESAGSAFLRLLGPRGFRRANGNAHLNVPAEVPGDPAGRSHPSEGIGGTRAVGIHHPRDAGLRLAG